MTEANIKRINELAHIIADRRSESGHFDFKICPRETEELFTLMLEQYKPEFTYIYAENAFYKAFEESLKKYDPKTGNFMPFFKTVFNSRKKDELRKPKNKASKNESLDQPITNYDGNNPVLFGDTINDNLINIVEAEESRIIIESFYQKFASICIERKKKYNLGKRICYPPLFFTDKLIFGVFNSEMWFNDIVKRNSNKFDEAAVSEFLNILVTGKCYSVTDIIKYDCKSLFEFTGNQKDLEKPCCCEEPNYHVFYSYLKQQNKDITQSAFSQQKKNLAKMLKSIKNELECD